MKYLMTFEKYQTYSDYEKQRSKWATPEELKADATTSLKKLLPTFDEKWIDSTEEQSDDEKGIKFEFKVGKDLIHMFKVDRWRGQWEYYLNKKKSDEYKIQKHFDETLLSPLETFLKYATGYDFYAAYIDNGRQYQNAVASNQRIEDRFNKLSGSDQKKAIKDLYKKFNKEDVDRVFK